MQAHHEHGTEGRVTIGSGGGSEATTKGKRAGVRNAFGQILALSILIAMGLTACAPATEKPITVRVGYPSIPQGAYLASLLSWPQLGVEGILVEPHFIARTDLTVQAVINGDVELGLSPTNLIVESNLRGADLVILAAPHGNDWAVASPTKYQSFADLAGQRVAVHGPGSLAELYVVHLAREYDIDVEIVNIPGSAVRAQALLSEEIQASPVFLTDLLLIEMEAPGKFHVLVNLAEEFPQNPVDVLYARHDWVEQNPDLVTKIIANLLRTYQRVADDPEWAIAQAPAYLGHLPPELIVSLVPEYVDRGIWPVDGGLNEELAAAMLDFLIETKGLDPELGVVELSVADHFDLRPLERALKELGR